jgi:hypothetical protein
MKQKIPKMCLKVINDMMIEKGVLKGLEEKK